MRVLFFVLAIVGLAIAQDVPSFPQNPIESQTLQLGSFPFYFCHSYCTFEGEYDFQRFWAEPDPQFVADTHIFDWSPDGPLDFWTDDCGDVIEYYRYPPTVPDEDDLLYSESRLRNCQPSWIYIENVEINYNRFNGWFQWTHRINDAFIPTEDAWSEWSDLAHDAKRGNNIGDSADAEYDGFDGLLRYYPEPQTSSITGRFNNDYFYRETYIGNYEPNYCTMKMPHMVVNTELNCNGHIIDDSDDFQYPTRQYCLFRGAWIDEDDTYEFGCGARDSDDCDTVDFDVRNSRTAQQARTTPSKTERLRQATKNSEALAHYEKRNDVYDLFYYQNDVAGVQFPYCAVKEPSTD